MKIFLLLISPSGLKKKKFLVYKNILVISLAWVFLFTSFTVLASLQVII